MARLKYSPGAMLRRIGMSRKVSLFVFVEGKVNDPFLAEFLCSTSQEISKRGYEIRTISDVIRGASGDGAGGKSAAVAFFDFCKAQGKLVQSNSGGNRAVAFLLDRDAQQVTGGRRRSPHVIYTLEADAEAHFYADSDEVAALALAATIDRAAALKLSRALGNWRRDLANEWRQWIELCYLAEAVRSRCWVGFGKAKSLVHVGNGFGKLDSTKLNLAEQEVKNTALVKGAQYAAIKAKILSRLDGYYRRGAQATLLKGKWLAHPVSWLVAEYFAKNGDGPDSWNQKDFAGSVTRSFAARLDEKAKSIVHLRGRLEYLLATP